VTLENGSFRREQLLTGQQDLEGAATEVKGGPSQKRYSAAEEAAQEKVPMECEEEQANLASHSGSGSLQHWSSVLLNCQRWVLEES
jgi:hypothetical protein